MKHVCEGSSLTFPWRIGETGKDMDIELFIQYNGGHVERVLQKRLGSSDLLNSDSFDFKVTELSRIMLSNVGMKNAGVYSLKMNQIIQNNMVNVVVHRQSGISLIPIII